MEKMKMKMRWPVGDMDDGKRWSATERALRAELQAARERVAELEAEDAAYWKAWSEDQSKIIEQVAAREQAALAELATAREVLAWYASPKRWRIPASQPQRGGIPTTFDPPECGDDMHEGWMWAAEALDELSQAATEYLARVRAEARAEALEEAARCVLNGRPLETREEVAGRVRALASPTQETAEESSDG